MTVNFDATLPSQSSTQGDVVLRRGKIFEVGNFPDKGFSVTAEEARAACENFQVCECDLEHKNTILDGHLGKLVSVEFGSDGKTIFGTVAEPKYLAELLGDVPRKVSVCWDIVKKRIVGIAHVLNPRISDAQLVAAFSASTEGKTAAQHLADYEANRAVRKAAEAKDLSEYLKAHGGRSLNDNQSLNDWLNKRTK